MLNLDGCNFTETTVRATEILYTLAIFVLLPYYLVLSPIFNLLLIVALARCVRVKPPFIYQLLLVCAKSAENLVYSIYLAGMYWFGGSGGYVAPWFTASYVILFAYGRCLNVAYSFLSYLVLYLAVSMAADRVLSLCHPMRYRNMNHRTIRCAVLVLGACLSLGVSLDKYWSNMIVERVDRNGTKSYAFMPSRDYNNTLWGLYSESVRTYARISLTIALIVLNCLMIDRYRRRMRKLNSMSVGNEEKVRTRKEANKDVVILCLCQSMLTCFGQIPFTTAQMLRQTSTYWARCYFVSSPESIAAIILATVSEFYLLVAVNGKIRSKLPGYKVMSRVFPCLVEKNTGRPSQVNTTTRV